jgi:hypothetical protein
VSSVQRIRSDLSAVSQGFQPAVLGVLRESRINQSLPTRMSAIRQTGMSALRAS